MVHHQRKMVPVQVLMKLDHFKKPEPVLPCLSMVFSVLDIAAIGCSDPSFILCVRTVPSPYAEESQAKTSSLLSSECTSRLADCSRFLDC